MAWRLDDASAASSCTTPNFGPPTFYGAGAVRSIAVADFDGDGNTDLASVTSDLSGIMVLSLGDGTGAFPFRGTFSEKGRRPNSIAAGDFDSDGRPDIVIANGVSVEGDVTVYLNHDLAFDQRIPVYWSSGSATGNTSVAVADFNADGKLDVASTSTEFKTVNIALGDGAGTFSNLKSFNCGGQSPAHVVARDFNGDGKPDLAVANSLGVGNNVSILLGDGTGNFGAATAYAAGQAPTFIAPGDFNSDNKLDLAVVANSGAQNVSILIGNGAGAFAAPTFVSSGGGAATGLAATDFNGDGKIDLAVANEQQGNVAILLGDGAGNFNLSASPTTGSTSPGVIVAPDLDGDGTPDLVVGHESARVLSVLFNGCGATTARLSFNAPSFSASEFANTVTITVIRNGSLAGPVTVNYATSEIGEIDIPAESPSDYKATSGTLTFADGEASKTFSVELVNDSLDEETEVFLVRLSNPIGVAVLGGLSEIPVRIFDDDPTLTYTINDVSVAEGEGRATLTVTRTSDVSGVGSVDYRTADNDNFTVGCSDANNNRGSAYARCDFATAIGRIDFAAGESQKTFTIPIIDDGHVEGAETFGIGLSNTARPSLGVRATATVTITDNDAAGAPNPVVSTFPFFVRQQYLDFLSREPDTGGFNAWLGVLNGCPNAFTGPSVPSQCDRIYVSGEGFFRSLEFQLKGFYVFRFYRVAFGRLPEYAEIVSDMSFVAGATEQEVYARKAQLARLFTMRQEFRIAYFFQSNNDFVAALLGRNQITQITTPDPAQPDGTAKVTLTQAALVNRLDTNTLTRAQVFRAVADSDEVAAREFDNAFVGMQYYGYLRRKPEPAGFQAWLNVLRSGDVRTMVDGFLNSTEYKLRFGKP
jgi:hypothetical protein